MLSHKTFFAICSTVCICTTTYATQPELASGDLLNPDQLEAKGIYMLDGLLAASLVYGLERSHPEGAAENLLNLETDWVAGAKPFRSTTKLALQAKRGECGAKRETFARSDCAKEVMNDFVSYGKLASSAKFVRIDYRGLIRWDEQSEALLFYNTVPETYAAEVACMDNAICTPIGSFAPRNFKFVVCLHLPENSTYRIQAGPLAEVQARALSTQYGDLRRLKTSMIAELTRPVKALSEPQQCPISGNKLAAEGWITPRAMAFGDTGHASFVATSLKYIPNK